LTIPGDPEPGGAPAHEGSDTSGDPGVAAEPAAGEPAPAAGEPAPEHAPPPPATLTFRLVNAGVRALMTVGRIRLEIEGLDRLPDRPGIILASNHLSFADPVLLAMAVHRAIGRRVRHMAKAEAVAVPVFGLLLRDYGGFAVRRGRPDREAFRMARDVLAGGDWLGLAPEGTRSRTGILGEPKPGVALLAVRSGAEIVPVAVWGTEDLWPVGALLPRPGKTVHIRFGSPYRIAVGADGPAPDGTDGSDAPQRRTPGTRHGALETASEDLMRRIAALLPASYRGRFG
jgi:1-acyl-sn-glycerol-3-phosphate acyltransferase